MPIRVWALLHFVVRQKRKLEWAGKKQLVQCMKEGEYMGLQDNEDMV